MRFGAGASMFLGPALLMAAFAGHPDFLGLPLLMESPRAQADLPHLVGHSAFPFLAVCGRRSRLGPRSLREEAVGGPGRRGLEPDRDRVHERGVRSLLGVAHTTVRAERHDDGGGNALPALASGGNGARGELYLSSGRLCRWSGTSVFVGSLVILVFVENDPAMFVGVSPMLLGLVPGASRSSRAAKRLCSRTHTYPARQDVGFTVRYSGGGIDYSPPG
jgi:hypothetical protein